jgi:uncharacterized protein (TIGR01777 family)
MRVLLAGGSGLIGRALVASLVGDAHEAVVLSRDPGAQRWPQGVRGVAWDGRTLGPWVEEIERSDAVVQLAGEPILGRWTAAKKERIRSSRVMTTRLLADAIAGARRRPGVLVQGSAVGYYGDTGDAAIDETAPAGNDFLAALAREWEEASAPVERLGVRRPVVRTGHVLSRQGGMLPPLRLAFRLFAGGRLGSGRQWMPLIHVADEVGPIRFLIEDGAATGPFNLVAPEPLRNADFARALGRALARPSWLPTPGWLLRRALGEMGDVVLGGQRALPAHLLAAGYRFRFSALPAALADLWR